MKSNQRNQSASSSSKQGQTSVQNTTASNQNPNKRNPNSRNGNNQKKREERHEVTLSRCSMNYARSLVNPFTGPGNACVPSSPALLTRKMRCFAKGVFSTGTANVGFVYADPYGFVANDNNAVFASNNLFTGASFQAAGVGVQLLRSNSEYASAAIGPGIFLAQYRLVSAGLRVRYIGTELNRGGQLVGFTDPNHQGLSGRNLSDIDGEEESARFAVDRKWKTTLYKPVFALENDFQTTLTPLLPSVNFMGFITISPALNEPFEFEYYCNYEIIGRNVRGKSVSEVDPTGIAAVQTAMLTSNMQPNEKTTNQSEKDMVRTTQSHLDDNVSTSKPKTLGFFDEIGNFFKSDLGSTILDVGLDLLEAIW